MRKAGHSVGNIMKSWRELTDERDAETRRWFEEVEVMQQPAGYCDGVIVAWIQEMRLREGYTRLITVRDLFGGALSGTAARSSVLCSCLRAWIAGKMAAVMQLAGTPVAFGLKRHVEAVNGEVRREKRGAGWEAVWGGGDRVELKVWGQGFVEDPHRGMEAPAARR